MLIKDSISDKLGDKDVSLTCIHTEVRAVNISCIQKGEGKGRDGKEKEKKRA